jgi:MoxR-like ATPase
VKSLGTALGVQFERIQFTPDLLPSDVVGTMIFQPKTGEFTAHRGPIFANLVLADEINRAPAKVQSALLEAMQERQVTIGDQTFPLPEPFLVLATQNPIEQEGTYPLPEAQVDRFMLKLRVTYPTMEEEREIMSRHGTRHRATVTAVVTPEDIARARDVADTIYVDAKLQKYIVSVVCATRNPKAFGLAELAPLIQYGASPRASIFLLRAAKAYAFLRGRAYVSPQDVKDIGADVLRHRVILTYEAEAEDLSSDDLVRKIFDRIDVP